LNGYPELARGKMVNISSNPKRTSLDQHNTHRRLPNVMSAMTFRQRGSQASGNRTSSSRDTDKPERSRFEVINGVTMSIFPSIYEALCSTFVLIGPKSRKVVHQPEALGMDRCLSRKPATIFGQGTIGSSRHTAGRDDARFLQWFECPPWVRLNRFF
jgi:hypothetical protein